MFSGQPTYSFGANFNLAFVQFCKGGGTKLKWQIILSLLYIALPLLALPVSLWHHF